jgi:hypothetical protein
MLSNRRKLLGALLAFSTLGILGTTARDAEAYPQAVVFAPTAESRPLGKVGAFAYGATVVSPRPRSFSVAPWFSVQGGVLPSFTLAKGVETGGAEVGFDVLGPGDGTYKPVLNGKLSLLKQVGWVPSVGVGFMQFAPTKLNQGLNMGYLALTEGVTVGNGVNLGSITLGMGRSFMQRPDDPSAPVFHGTWPFAFDDRYAPIVGYTSPTFLGGFSVGVEHISGYSEMSGTTAGVFYAPKEWIYFAAGGMLGNDRSTAYRADYAFTMVGFEFELLKKKEPPTPPPAPIQGKN